LLDGIADLGHPGISGGAFHDHTDQEQGKSQSYNGEDEGGGDALGEKEVRIHEVGTKRLVVPEMGPPILAGGYSLATAFSTSPLGKVAISVLKVTKCAAQDAIFPSVASPPRPD
jgi:hypothetical protein